MNKETGQPPEKEGIAMDVCHTCIEKAKPIFAASLLPFLKKPPN
jgi:hypothetical protein